MITSPGKEVVVVVIMTGYADGTFDFTQDAPRKDRFAQVARCFHHMRAHFDRVLADQMKCPFNPKNTQPFKMEQGGKVKSV